MTSPLQRCVETASHVALALHCPLQVVDALGECAAAIRSRLADGRFLNDHQIASLVPPLVKILPRDTTIESFESALLRLTSSTSPTSYPPITSSPKSNPTSPSHPNPSSASTPTS